MRIPTIVQRYIARGRSIITGLRSANTRRLRKQIVREFWFPFIIGIAWTLFPSHYDLKSSLIANFAGSFFLTSWAIGQIMRINRQHAVEDSFKSVESSFKSSSKVIETFLVELRSTMRSLSGASDELQERTKDMPSLKPVVEEISHLTSTADTRIAVANTAFSKARMHDQAAGNYEGVGALFGSESSQNLEVWKALLDRDPDRQSLIVLGREWLSRNQEQPGWPFLWQTLLDHEGDKQSLIVLGREWLEGRIDEPEWPYVWRNLLDHDTDRPGLLALGHVWLRGHEDRPEWPFIWRKLLDHDPDPKHLLALGRDWLREREHMPGERVIREKMLSYT